MYVCRKSFKNACKMSKIQKKNKVSTNAISCFTLALSYAWSGVPLIV